jgi:hypothetical protein
MVHLPSKKNKCGCTTHRFLQDFFSAILTGKK